MVPATPQSRVVCPLRACHTIRVRDLEINIGTPGGARRDGDRRGGAHHESEGRADEQAALEYESRVRLKAILVRLTTD